ncbi:HAD family hydrolase [Trichothermofontia sp.]
MSTLQALIFDVDGTIAETERDGHRLAFNQAFAEAGLDWHWSVERYGQLLEVAGGKERIQFYLDSLPPDRAARPSIPVEQIPAWIADLHTAKTRHYRSLLQTGCIPPRPGIFRLLQAARAQGLRLAIATTSAPDNAIALLQTALGPDSPDWFEVIAAGDIVAAKKPAPDVYAYVLKALDLPPQACLAIEDSQQGLEAATQAQLVTVVTCNDYTRHQDFRLARLVLDHLGDPDRPFQILQGQVEPPSPYFTLDLAEHLLR